ncbi:MAG: sigma-54-dependent Fis family transcriptional regulator [Chlorobi bacterium]|nr:sigma-54-dependent Fis family transcriptional regulator [Chlorobiota bacterium]
MPPLILIVDDDDTTRLLWRELLEMQGYQVEDAGSTLDAFERIDASLFDLIITDLLIDNHTGIDVLIRAKKVYESTEVIVITGHGSIDTAVEAMQNGAYTYITKPVDTEALVMIVKNALEHYRLRHEVRNLKNQIHRERGFDSIIHRSDPMRRLIDFASRVAATDSSILILGESGVGKEVLAQAIHDASPRSDKNFIAINCGALPETLLESELFGFVKGAFTGAVSARKGLFEEADGGTLFLDEIGETSPSMQVKLLRVLQEGEIRRIGDVRNIPVDVRIIAATNKDLDQMVQEKKFREDLLFRLRVIPLTVPPLRQRVADIPLLAEHFIKFHCKKMDRKPLPITSRAMNQLLHARWKGNVRELQNLIERAIVLNTDDVIDLDDINPDPDWESEHIAITGDVTLRDMEKLVIEHTLKRCMYNQAETARRLGIGRNTLWRKIKQYEIEIP